MIKPMHAVAMERGREGCVRKREAGRAIRRGGGRDIVKSAATLLLWKQH